MALIGVDTGGTFTDFIVNDDGDIRILKVLSTPDNPALAVLQGLGQLGHAPQAVVHGSTVATNAILERKGVKTALITNQGFTDVLQIGRQERSDLYALDYRRPAALIPQSLRFGIAGRISPRGEETQPFDADMAEGVAEAVRECGAESVAVCLLFSFANPAHELAMQEILRRVLPDAAISLSHRILAEFREFERTSTTAMNAYVSPRMDRYLTDLTENIDAPLRIMQSNGGSISARTAMRESVRTILSGPAGGVVGAMECGRRAGHERLMTFDMGGTSTDVALLDGRLPLTTGTVISGYPVKTPMLDIHTVGAGGGSIAAFDAGGALTVGPASAGADPGPVCYGKGERITVTDANLYLGRLVAHRFLGGGMQLDMDRLHSHMNALAAKAGLAPARLAEGILQVADSNMERALRVISVERGHDPREFTLLSFGGAGGLHCASLARLLGMRRVLVPPSPGILSAMGMLMAEVIKDFSLTIMQRAEQLDGAELDRIFTPLQRQAAEAMRAEGVTTAVRFERFLDMRYEGQSFELMVPLPAAGRDAPSPHESCKTSEACETFNVCEAFEVQHERQYGHRNQRAVEAVNLRLRAAASAGLAMACTKPDRDNPSGKPGKNGTESQVAVFDGREHETRVLDRAELLPGEAIQGPAIITEYSSTIVVPPDVRAETDAQGNLLLTISD